MKAYDVISVNIVAAKENANVIEISTRIGLGAFNGMPIINDNGSVIGIVTTLDILKAIQDKKNLDELTVKDKMTRNTAVLSQDAIL